MSWHNDLHKFLDLNCFYYLLLAYARYYIYHAIIWNYERKTKMFISFEWKVVQSWNKDHFKEKNVLFLYMLDYIIIIENIFRKYTIIFWSTGYCKIRISLCVLLPYIYHMHLFEIEKTIFYQEWYKINIFFVFHKYKIFFFSSEWQFI